jgi:hypothetical protein
LEEDDKGQVKYSEARLREKKGKKVSSMTVKRDKMATKTLKRSNIARALGDAESTVKRFYVRTLEHRLGKD